MVFEFVEFCDGVFSWMNAVGDYIGMFWDGDIFKIFAWDGELFEMSFLYQFLMLSDLGRGSFVLSCIGDSELPLICTRGVFRRELEF